MPWYHQKCPECGEVKDAPRSVEEYKICYECGGPCEVLIYPTRTVGIVFSNAQESKQLGTRWETNKQKRDWMKAHPNAVEMTKGDANEQAFSQRIKQQMHDSLKSQGLTINNYKAGCRESMRAKALKKGKAEKKIVLDTGTVK
jgi:hypothetical protein